MEREALNKSNKLSVHLLLGCGEIDPMLGTYLSQEQNPGGYHGGC